MNDKNELLKGKKILFFAPAFFNYENVIKEKMEQMGAVVYLYDERTVKSAFLRALNKIVPIWFHSHSHKYFQQIINKHNDEDFDYIFVIKSDMVPIKTLKELKASFCNATLILYLYDSIKDIPGIEKQFDYYDRILTFDRADSIKNKRLVHRPLFFGDDYLATGQEKEYTYDIAFIGTIHSDRFRILKQIAQQATSLNMKAYWFFFLQAKFMFYVFWATKWEYKSRDKHFFTTTKMSGHEIASIVDKTRVIIDIESPGQIGLTMRTIEMLGLKKKLITTNPDVVHYDFYHPNNICVIDRNKPTLDVDFVKKTYCDIDKTIYQRYHICSWITDVFNVS